MLLFLSLARPLSSPWPRTPNKEYNYYLALCAMMG
jgi:hypothetical protein